MINIIIPHPFKMSKGPSWKTQVKETKIMLSTTFTPGKFDVICSRGKKAKSHSGNIFFQSLIQKSAPTYAATEGKLGKSLIVSEIIDTIRRKTPLGGFVKCIDERWHEVGDFMAREKVSQSLRDSLHGQYRSSASSKKRRKDAMNAKMIEDLDALVDSNDFVSNRMKNLSTIIQTQGSFVSDTDLSILMTQVNSEILGQLKIDYTLKEHMSRVSENSGNDSDASANRGKKRSRESTVHEVII
jgi:hypothetical protein